MLIGKHTRIKYCKMEFMPYLLHRGRPRKGKTQKHNEKERPPKIPIPQSLSWVLAIWVWENDQLQVADDPRQISFHCIPHRLRQRIRRGSEPGGANVRGAIAGRGQRRRSGDGWRFLVGGGGGGGWGNIGLNEGGRRDRDRGSRRAWRSGGKDGGGTRLDASVDEVLDLIDIGLGRRVEGHRVAM